LVEKILKAQQWQTRRKSHVDGSHMAEMAHQRVQLVRTELKMRLTNLKGPLAFVDDGHNWVG